MRPESMIPRKRPKTPSHGVFPFQGVNTLTTYFSPVKRDVVTSFFRGGRNNFQNLPKTKGNVMETVFVVISVLNGFKNVERIFERRDDAEQFVQDRGQLWEWSRHEFFIIEYPVR